MLDPQSWPDWIGGGCGLALLALAVLWSRVCRRRPPPPPTRPVATLPDVQVRVIPPVSDTDLRALLAVPPYRAGRWECGPRYSIEQVIADAEKELRQ